LDKTYQMDYHYICSKVLYGGRIVSHCLEDQIVDIIVTKTLGMVKFQSFKRKIGRCKLREEISIEAHELTDNFISLV
jgi:hypothetical protein